MVPRSKEGAYHAMYNCVLTKQDNFSWSTHEPLHLILAFVLVQPMHCLSQRVGVRNPDIFVLSGVELDSTCFQE